MSAALTVLAWSGAILGTLVALAVLAIVILVIVAAISVAMESARADARAKRLRAQRNHPSYRGPGGVR